MSKYHIRIRNSRNVFYLVIILAAALFWSELALADEARPVVATGMAAILQGNMDISRDQAIEDALRKAVEQAVGTMVDSESLLNNSTLLYDRIYTSAHGYVKKYKIIKEQRKGQDIWVTVRAFVDIGNLENDLSAIGLLYRRIKKPRFMVVMSENMYGRRINEPASETEIIHQLIKKGIKTVDQTQVKRIRKNDQIRKALEGDIKSAKRIGMRFGAEVLLIGKAFSERPSRNYQLGGLYSAQARLEIRAIRVDTGEILTAHGQSSASVDVSPQKAGKKALEKAASNWMEENFPLILAQWGKESSSVSSMQLVVNGLNMRQLIRFEEILKTRLRGVSDIQQRNFDHNSAVLDIDFKGSGQTLVTELTQRNLGGFHVEITTFSPHRMELNVNERR